MVLKWIWYWLITAEISGCWSLKVRTGHKPRYDGNKGWIESLNKVQFLPAWSPLNASQFYPVKELFRWDGWRIMNQNNVLKCTCQVHFKSFKKKILWNFHLFNCNWEMNNLFLCFDISLNFEQEDRMWFPQWWNLLFF